MTLILGYFGWIRHENLAKALNITDPVRVIVETTIIHKIIYHYNVQQSLVFFSITSCNLAHVLSKTDPVIVSVEQKILSNFTN